MSAGSWIVVSALALAFAFGLYRALTDGRFRGTHVIKDEREPNPLVEPHLLVEPNALVEPVETALGGTSYVDHLGERATLVQFSSAFCAPCRTTRHILADVAARVDGVVHLEIDAENHLELVRRLGILRTPTTLVLDGAGQELMRATGAPRRGQVEAALSSL